MPLCVPNTDHAPWIIPLLLPVPSTTHLCLYRLPPALRKEGQHTLNNQEHLPSNIWDGWVAQYDRWQTECSSCVGPKGRRNKAEENLWDLHVLLAGFDAGPDLLPQVLGCSVHLLLWGKVWWGCVFRKLRWAPELGVSPCAAHILGEEHTLLPEW